MTLTVFWPERAVELLEVMKLFLDIPNCIYILALDYQVVQRGLLTKFKLSPDEIGGRSFFDKIIQLPFSMPVSQYDINSYLSRMFNRLKLRFKERDLELLRELLANSVGLNPRSLKRLVNNLTLLSIVNKKTNTTDEGEFQDEDRTRLLFALICLQSSYEPLYHYLQAHPYEKGIEQLMDTEHYAENDEIQFITKRIPSFNDKKIQIAKIYEVL